MNRKINENAKKRKEKFLQFLFPLEGSQQNDD